MQVFYIIRNSKNSKRALLLYNYLLERLHISGRHWRFLWSIHGITTNDCLRLQLWAIVEKFSICNRHRLFILTLFSLFLYNCFIILVYYLTVCFKLFRTISTNLLFTKLVLKKKFSFYAWMWQADKYRWPACVTIVLVFIVFSTF